MRKLTSQLYRDDLRASCNNRREILLIAFQNAVQHPENWQKQKMARSSVQALVAAQQKEVDCQDEKLAW